MLNFSIMPTDMEHINEICEDISYQIESGIATMPLFKFTLTPEGIPAIDKADMNCLIYEKFKKKLDSMGIPSGVLIQASIGHGQKLNEPSSFQKYVGLKDGEEMEVCCPLDKDFQEYIRNSAMRIAKSNPDHIMLDDDFRLMGRQANGCACTLHLERLSDIIGQKLTGEQLWDIINNKNIHNHKQIRQAFIKTQIDSLLECAKEIRKGIDSVNPSIPGSFCLCGAAAEGAYEIAKIMAGEKNPVVIRVNNANYCSENTHDFVGKSLHRASMQISALSEKPDVLLAETDTCPQNRYSTSAAKLHTHFTFSILEGIGGAKHWITRLFSYEPKSGTAYRKKLEKHTGFYNELCRITKDLTWFGCKIPVPDEPQYVLAENDVSYKDCDGWCSHILDRFGLPMHFSNSGEGTVFFDGKRDEFFTDDKLYEFLSGNIVLDAVSAKAFVKRGFSKYLGIDIKCRDSNAKKASGEIYCDGRVSQAQYQPYEIIPLSEKVKRYSDIYHLRDGKYKDVLSPGVTCFENELGGNVTVFSGNTSFPFTYYNAFGFLNETRKSQLVRILKDMGSLPVYYPGDAEVFMKAARTNDGSLFCALVDVGLDAIEDLELSFDKKITGIRRLCADGSYRDVAFENMKDCVRLNITAYPFDPVILIVDLL